MFHWIAAIIWAIIIGTVLGFLGRLIVPGRQNISVWATIGVGIAAALVGGIIATWLGVGETPGIDWIKHIIQVVLAAVGVALVAGLGTRRGARSY